MPLKILSLPAQFRPGTSITYPPFKKGRYMEEYAYEYFMVHALTIETTYVYIPIFWTNMQNHPGFQKIKEGLTILLQREIEKLPKDTKYFTIVQHDDGPQLSLPKDTIVFGACTGTIPLPLIYEDTTNYLLSHNRPFIKDYVASFVGTLTHPVREKMVHNLPKNNKIHLITKPLAAWTNNVANKSADAFVKNTLRSKFCLAPRGYGRSSFRFFEAMLLDTIPVYFWDDIEWLPYKEKIDYSTFAVSIAEKDIEKTYQILESISEEKYQSMLQTMKNYRHLFTLEGMCDYIKERITQ